MISTCPRHLPVNSSIVRACVTDAKYDAFSSLPVFDSVTFLTYKNYFCAKCNSATNLTFWRVKAKCSQLRTNDSNDLLSQCNEYEFKPQNYNQSFCVLRKKTHYSCSLRADHKKWQRVEEICRAYMLPFCYAGRMYDNPHCLLCLHNQAKRLSVNYCQSLCPVGVRPPNFRGKCNLCKPAALSVIFDFSSTSQYEANIKGRGRIEIIADSGHCNENQVYDPFSRICRDSSIDLVSAHTTYNTTTGNNITSSLQPNCVLTLFHLTEIEIFHNESLLVKPHGKVYNKSFYIVLEDKVAVCTNFTSNYTKNRKINSVLTTESIEAFVLRIITYVGGSLSLISLVLLLVVYVKIAEYKKLSGKILMSLSCALLSYQVLFFVTGATGIPILCCVVAVGVHYFLLASFTWTSVLAFEMAATFVPTSKWKIFICPTIFYAF